MPYSPLAIANTFLAEHGGEGGISHMKLQKLVFYAYGWWLAYHDQPLTNEAPEVWRYGPVFSSLYSALAQNGMEPISRPQRAVPIGTAPIVPDDDEETRSMLEWIWDHYGKFSAGRLSDMTHADGTPWQQEAAAHNYRVPKHHPIPDARIKAHFQDKAAKLAPPVV